MDINPITIPLGKLTIPQAVEIAIEELRITSEGVASKYQYAKTFERIERWSSAAGLIRWVELDEHQCRKFIFANKAKGALPALPTSRWRRTTINRIYGALRRAGYPAVDQTFLIDLSAGRDIDYSQAIGRPLTDAEIRTCELAAETKRSQYRSVFALACATADASESVAIRPADLDLEAATVRIHGAFYRFERVGSLTPWGVRALRSRVAEAGPDCNLVTRGEKWQSQLARASGCLDVVLCAAGLRHDPLVRLSSIRGWAGRKVYEEEGLEAAAAALGVQSLDTAARVIGIKRPRKAR